MNNSANTFPRPNFPPPPHIGAPINSNVSNNNYATLPGMQNQNPLFSGPPIIPTTFPPIPDLIFEGHIVSNRQYNIPDPNPTVNEIFFKSKKYFIGGLHIVPNKIKVPGTNFEGKTVPDMSMRPFSLHVFARVVSLEQNNFSVQHILSLTINGGIEWLPIPHPFDKLPIDYLSFDGDFDVLSMMIHGTVVDLGIVEVEEHLPVPTYYNDILLENNEVEFEFIGRDSITLVEKKEIEEFHQKLNSSIAKPSIYENLSKMQLQKSSSISKIDSMFSVRYKESLVPIQRVAKLVEQVFSIEVSTIDNLTTMSNLLEYCWKMDPIDLDRSSSATVQMAIGVEAATLMVEILLKQLHSLRSDVCSNTALNVSFLDSEENKELLRKFHHDGMEIIRYCRNLLANEFTATEFIDAGGIEVLISLLQQQPSLPMKILEQLMFSLLDASLFSNVALKILKSPSNSQLSDETTVYQSILYIAAGLKTTSSLFGPTKCLVNWLSFVDTSKEIQQLVSSMTEDLVSIADAIGWRNSLNNSSAVLEDISDNNNNNNIEENENSLLHTTMEVIAKLYGQLAPVTNRFIHCASSIRNKDFINIYKNSTTTSEPLEDVLLGFPYDNSLCSSVLDILHSTNFIASLASLVSFASLVSEFENILDWSSSLSHELISYSRYTNQIVISLVSQLLKFPKFEILLISCSEDVELIRNFVQKESNKADISFQYLTLSDSLSVTDCRYEGIEYIDNNLVSFVTSTSWTMWLIVHVFSILKEIFDDLFSIDNYEEGTTSVSIYELLMTLITLTTNNDIKTLVSRIISQYYINSFIKILNLLFVFTNDSFMNGVTEKIFNIFEIFMNNIDIIALNNIFRKKNQILQLLTNLKVGNSNNVFFNNQNTLYRISQLSVILELEIDRLIDNFENDKFFAIIQKSEANISGSTLQLSRFINFFIVNDNNRSSIILNIINIFVIKLCESGLKSNVTGNFGMEDLKALNSIDNVLQYNNNLLSNLFSCLSFICRNLPLLLENYYLFANHDEIKLLIDIVLYSHMFSKSILCEEYKTVFANESIKIKSLCKNLLLFFINNKSNKSLNTSRRQVFSYMISQSIIKPQLLDSVIELIGDILPGGHYIATNPVPIVSNCVIFKDDNISDFFNDIFAEPQENEKEKSEDSLTIRKEILDLIELKECPDILYQSCYDNKVSLEIVALMNFSSCVKSIRERSLILSKILFSSNKAEALKFGRIISHYLERYLSLSLQLFSNDNNRDETTISVTINILTFIDTIAADEIPCYILVQCGTLFSLLCGLRSDMESITLLSLQCLTTIYKVLNKITIRTNNNSNINKNLLVSLNTLLSLVLYKLSFGIIELLPSLLKNYKNNSNLNMMQQISLFLQLMPSVNIKQFLLNLNSIGEGLTIEFLAVKLWIEFEESFQLMVEATDILKLLSSSWKTDSTKDLSVDDVTKSFCTYHVLFMRACVSLKAITDLTLKSYVENIINLSTLSKAMRTSLADPKKLVIRYQRLYTMWASGLSNIIGMDASYTKSSYLSDYYDNELFESRQNVISLSLKGLVDNLSKFSKFFLSKEEKYGGGLNPELSAIDDDIIKFNIDFRNPFVMLDKKFPTLSDTVVNNLFENSSYYSRLSHRVSAITNIVHNDLRRHLKPNPSCNLLKSDIIALTVPSIKRQIDLIEGKPSKRKFINYTVDTVVVVPKVTSPQHSFTSNQGFNKVNKNHPKPHNPVIGQKPMNVPPNMPPNHFHKF